MAVALSVEFNISKSCATKLSQISKVNGYSDKIIFNIFPKKRIKQKAESKYSFVSSKDLSFRPALNQLRNLFKTSGPSKKEASTCFVFCFDAHPAEKAWNEANTPKNRRPPGAKRTIPAVMDWFGGIQMSSFSWAVVKTCEMIGKPKPVNP